MARYVWLAHDRDGTHDWFDASDDEHAVVEARRLTAPVFDAAHVDDLTVEIWTRGGRFLGFIEHRLGRGRYDA